MPTHTFKIAPLTLRFDAAGKPVAHKALLNGARVFEMPQGSAKIEPTPMTPDRAVLETVDIKQSCTIYTSIRLT